MANGVANVQNEVFEIISKQLGVKKDDIKLESAFVTDLGADSLDLVELVMAFEDKFGIEIPEDKAESIKTVVDAVKQIESASA